MADFRTALLTVAGTCLLHRLHVAVALQAAFCAGLSRILVCQVTYVWFCVWQVGQWSTCGGDASYGHSSRPAVCVDGAGNIVNPGSSTCMSTQPSSKVMCLTEATLTACRPSFLPALYFRGQDCYGHGLCGADGCDCKDGWRGQFCEVAPRCKGVMDRRDKCCTSGVLNITGDCCPAGSVLDSAGSCCAGGQVDVCGVCGGTSWTVDVRVSVYSSMYCCPHCPAAYLYVLVTPTVASTMLVDASSKSVGIIRKHHSACHATCAAVTAGCVLQLHA